jgi:hypothetical protein
VVATPVVAVVLLVDAALVVVAVPVAVGVAAGVGVPTGVGVATGVGVGALRSSSCPAFPSRAVCRNARNRSCKNAPKSWGSELVEELLPAPEVEVVPEAGAEDELAVEAAVEVAGVLLV